MDTRAKEVFSSVKPVFLTFVLHLNRPIFGEVHQKKPLDLIHFFVQSLNAPLLPVAMYSSYEARKNTLQTICSATFAPFTPHYTPLHHQRHHTTKKQRHTRTRTCKCTCICICMCTCRCTCMCIYIYINISHEKQHENCTSKKLLIPPGSKTVTVQLLEK